MWNVRNNWGLIFSAGSEQQMSAGAAGWRLSENFGYRYPHNLLIWINKSCFQHFYLISKYLLCYIYQIQSHNGCVELESVFQYPEKLWDSSKNWNPPPPPPEQGGLWPASVGIQWLCKTSIDQPVLNGVETLLLSGTAEVNTTFYWGNNQNQGKKYTLPTDFYFPQTNIFSWVSIYYCTFGMTEVETNKCPGNNYRARLIYCPVCHPG